MTAERETLEATEQKQKLLMEDCRPEHLNTGRVRYRPTDAGTAVGGAGLHQPAREKENKGRVTQARTEPFLFNGAHQ